MKRNRKEVIENARRKYARMRKTNPLVDELQRRFNLRIDVEAEASAEEPEKEPEERGVEAAPEE